MLYTHVRVCSSSSSSGSSSSSSSSSSVVTLMCWWCYMYVHTCCTLSAAVFHAPMSATDLKMLTSLLVLLFNFMMASWKHGHFGVTFLTSSLLRTGKECHYIPVSLLLCRHVCTQEPHTGCGCSHLLPSCVSAAEWTKVSQVSCQGYFNADLRWWEGTMCIQVCVVYSNAYTTSSPPHLLTGNSWSSTGQVLHWYPSYALVTMVSVTSFPAIHTFAIIDVNKWLVITK